MNEFDAFDEPSMKTMRGNAEKGTLGRIDQYDIIRKLGGGGFGVVYLVRDSQTDVEYAIKTLHPLLKTNPEEMENLRSQFKLVSQLFHVNIANAIILHPVRDFSFETDEVRKELHISTGDSIMVMKYAPGVTLSKWKKQFAKNLVPIDKAIEICRQIANALDFAHSEGVIHRDIKPENIMVETRENRSIVARVLDFGLAAEIRSSMSRLSTDKGDTSGTRPYMAPEQWMGKRQGPATDQYALACVFYELVSGEVPFAGVFQTGDVQIMMNVVRNDAPEEIELLTNNQNAVLQKALSKQLTERFSTCLEFVDALTKNNEIYAPQEYLQTQNISNDEINNTSENYSFSNTSNIEPCWQFDSGSLEAEYVNTGEPYEPLTEEDQKKLLLDVEKYLNGDGVEKNVGKAFEILFYLAQNDNAIAQYTLGDSYLKGNVLPQNNRNAFEFFLKSAENGNADAQYSLGLCFNEGLGVSQNYVESAKWFSVSANQGNIEAQYNLGVYYYEGIGVSKNLEEAVKWFKKAAEQGHLISQNNMGICYDYGYGVKKDHVVAEKWYRKAAEQGLPEAQYNLGLSYEYGYGVVQNIEEAKKWYHIAAEQGEERAINKLTKLSNPIIGDSNLQTKVQKKPNKNVIFLTVAGIILLGAIFFVFINNDKKSTQIEAQDEVRFNQLKIAAEQGDAQAQYELGIHYYSTNLNQQNRNDAAKWFQKSAEQGHVDAQYSIGYCYETGFGVSQNFVEALGWYRKAAEQGHATAQYNLGISYHYGNGVQLNYEEAVRWYRKAAEQGYADAQNELGTCYYNGEGVTKNYAEAVKWFRKAAAQGFAMAQYNLGISYHYGNGVQLNYEEAVRWYRKAAGQGYADAQNNLGHCYESGNGVAPDYLEAAKWYRKAADQGNAIALYNLGRCNENYLGNYVEAVNWYRKAAEQGNQDAIDALQRLGQK